MTLFPEWAHARQHRGTLGMGVFAAYRDRGIGRSLLEACIAKAQAKGISRIELEARSDNARHCALRAVRFCGGRPQPPRDALDGIDDDGVRMALLSGLA